MEDEVPFRLVGTFDTQKTVGNFVGLAALVAAVDDSLGYSSEIFDQNDAQGNCRSPQFADRERLLLLVGVDERAPCIDIEAAVGVCDKCPDQAEHSWQAGKGTVGKLGQFAIITRREIQPDFANLALDKMKIVNQPLRGGCNCRLVVSRGADRPIGVDEARFVGRQPAEKRVAHWSAQFDRLNKRQAARMLLQPLGAEKRFTNGLRIVPRRF